MLYVKRSGTRSWVQRLTIHGERIDIGHGSADPDTAESVSLARARKVALDNRKDTRGDKQLGTRCRAAGNRLSGGRLVSTLHRRQSRLSWRSPREGC